MNHKHPYQTLLSLLLLCMVLPVYAHNGHVETASLQQGLLHPLSGMDHLLALLAVASLAVQRGGRWHWLLPLLFLGGLVAGSLVVISGMPLPGVEAMIVVSVMLFGGLLYLKPKNITLVTGLLFVFAVFHGYAHGSLILSNTMPPGYLAGILAGSAMTLVGGIAMAALLNRVHRKNLRWCGVGFSLAGLILVLGI